MPREDGRLLAAVRRAIGESMRDGGPTLAQVARKAALSRRTLQRRLQDYGIDFQAARRRYAAASESGYLPATPK